MKDILFALALILNVCFQIDLVSKDYLSLAGAIGLTGLILVFFVCLIEISHKDD